MSRKKLILLLALLTLVLAVIAAVFVFKRQAVAPDPTLNRSQRSNQKTGPAGEVKSEAVKATPPAFDKQRYSTDDPASPWVVANKLRPLKPADYAPQTAAPDIKLRLGAGQPEMRLAEPARTALGQLAQAAAKQGLTLMLASGYRPYNMQVSVYNNEVSKYGQAQADRQSARPGHSEHQTGLAADLAPANGNCMIEECFGSLPEGKWLAAHAHEHGFIIRYPQGKEAVTGYLYEPWHLRYVGPELAAEMIAKNITTLEEFFGLAAAPNYQ
jgi:D-alanyl-D-alanine carboxypeptidase